MRPGASARPRPARRPRATAGAGGRAATRRSRSPRRAAGRVALRADFVPNTCGAVEFARPRDHRRRDVESEDVLEAIRERACHAADAAAEVQRPPPLLRQPVCRCIGERPLGVALARGEELVRRPRRPPGRARGESRSRDRTRRDPPSRGAGVPLSSDIPLKGHAVACGAPPSLLADAGDGCLLYRAQETAGVLMSSVDGRPEVGCQRLLRVHVAAEHHQCLDCFGHECGRLVHVREGVRAGPLGSAFRALTG